MWKKRLLGVLAVLVLFVIAGGVGLVFYSVNGTYPPTAEALAALESDAEVTVTQDEWLIFMPTETTPTTGFIFYPGGLVDARAYAPYARAIAAEGYAAIITPMPLNLAVFDANAAQDVVNDSRFAAVKSWAVGGHSLGGSMAAAFVDGSPGDVTGLALWASYPAENNNLSAQDWLTAVSVYGTQDGLISIATIDGSRALLPSSTDFVEIEGGNHAQFGWYGPQEGDLPATIPHEAQQALTVDATITLLDSLGDE